MKVGEFVTRLSVWLALAAYGISAALQLRAGRRVAWARSAWSLGCAFFLAHVICAFAFFHAWSHGAAWRETARQTAEITGWRWGGGLYFNYLFAAAWLADVLWWWLAPESFARRPLWLHALWHAFFFFMVFNGAVVFAHGPMRWFGAILCVSLAALWWLRPSETVAQRPRKK